jgi:hypothetical protein
VAEEESKRINVAYDEARSSIMTVVFSVIIWAGLLVAGLQVLVAP